MNSKNEQEQQQSPSLAEGEAAEKPKKRPQTSLILDADEGRGTIASQTKTTRKLDDSIKHVAEDRINEKGKKE